MACCPPHKEQEPEPAEGAPAQETLEGAQSRSERSKPVLDVENLSKPDSGPEDADFIEILNVPIEEIQAEVAKQAANPVIQECKEILRDREMLRRNLESRLARGDFETFGEWTTAKRPGDESFEVVAGVVNRLISRANENLTRTQIDKN